MCLTFIAQHKIQFLLFSNDKIELNFLQNHTSEEPWVEFEDLALETRCKVEAMKMIARWLVGLKDDTISAQKTFRMLNAHITSKGDLHESGKLRYE